MPPQTSSPAAMPLLEGELKKLRTKANLSQAVSETDKLLELLIKAREEVASSTDAHSASLIMAKLQNPLDSRFESITDALRPVDRGQKAYGKVLDRSFPSRALPTEHDAMAEHSPLINRAIAMHLLREGQFNVARIFLQETQEKINSNSGGGNQDQDRDMTPADELVSESTPRTTDGSDELEEEEAEEGEEQEASYELDEEAIMAPLRSRNLQLKFEIMYEILRSLRSHDLIPAINWAADHSYELDARGSNLEFELNRLQFIYLFQQGGPDPEFAAQMTDEERRIEGRNSALQWARERFSNRGLQGRHAKDIQQLVTAVVFASNLPSSPYRHIFDASGIESAFSEAGTSFTRDFCSLLGLSAESPLYVAATAGAVALPQLLKYMTHVKEKGTEWTTEAELAFETPLPRSMIYHPIFVCPVSKEQTTDQNPPAMLPCGHVVAQESLQCLLKGTKAKCPYCPVEGHKHDAKIIEIL
ncbi:Protein RMD5 A [Zalerion maritima]|uniref:GID complex catalytic subunit 2 n=1 Tax=Zalerion maritima TaxID=339359 RepID=A0AAD5S2T7_9PEZI|nr:Protein RMD5 A [Zalerion maritima]